MPRAGDCRTLNDSLASLLKRGGVGDGPIRELLAGDRAAPIERVVVERPDEIRRALTQYLSAGAEWLSTSTLRAHPLAWTCAEPTAEDVCRTAVAVARGAADAAGRPVVVAGQIGPSGRFLEIGEVDEKELAGAVAEQAHWLAGAGADLLWLARFVDVRELRIALGAVRAACELPIVATMMFDSGPEGVETAAGQDAAQAAAVMRHADVVGCDCASAPTALLLARELRSRTDRPVLVRANAGLPELDGQRVTWSEDADGFAERAIELLRSGAAIVCGCCGTTPEHIRALWAAWTRSRRAT